MTERGKWIWPGEILNEFWHMPSRGGKNEIFAYFSKNIDICNLINMGYVEPVSKHEDTSDR